MDLHSMVKSTDKEPSRPFVLQELPLTYIIRRLIVLSRQNMSRIRSATVYLRFPNRLLSTRFLSNHDAVGNGMTVYFPT